MVALFERQFVSVLEQKVDETQVMDEEQVAIVNVVQFCAHCHSGDICSDETTAHDGAIIESNESNDAFSKSSEKLVSVMVPRQSLGHKVIHI